MTLSYENTWQLRQERLCEEEEEKYENIDSQKLPQAKT